MATGFTIVDVGGNWLRFFRTRVAANPTDATGAEAAGDADTTIDTDTDTEEVRVGLARVVDVAARQGDAHGDEARAIAILRAGILRHPSASPAVLFEAVLYLAELRGRIGEDPSEDLATAAGLLRTHALGRDAEDALRRLLDPS